MWLVWSWVTPAMRGSCWSNKRFTQASGMAWRVKSSSSSDVVRISQKQCTSWPSDSGGGTSV